MNAIRAVVLAAGRGERFNGRLPKPLARFFGRPLIDYALDSLEKEGISDIVVVYSDERVKEHVRGRARTVRNSHPELGGGRSLMLGAEAVGGDPFILLMADHVFDRRILSKLLASAPEVTTLCVDTGPSPNDPAEATKVRMDGSRILELGKELEDYSALDTGIFFCTGDVLEAARGFEGPFSVSQVMDRLARRGRLYACDVTGLFWMDIDTREELRKAEEAVIGALVKPSDGLVSRYINRKMSIPLSRLLVRTPVTPNQITVFSFLLGLLSAAFFFQGMPFWGGVTAQVTSIVDGCDGEVARMRNARSRFGAYLDSLLDRYADVAIVLGMIAAAPEALWHVGGLALLGTYSISYSVSRMETLAGTRFTGLLSGFMGRDVRLFMIMLGGMLNQIFLTLLVLGVLTNSVVAVRVINARMVMEGGGVPHMQAGH
ncbi:MAG: NTP transferase domain-containing protein [Euryarchaeota archaeon]|nr:NTP transferase domain-containing protein [Euryarchaeota archaeon]